MHEQVPWQSAPRPCSRPSLSLSWLRLIITRNSALLTCPRPPSGDRMRARGRDNLRASQKHRESSQIAHGRAEDRLAELRIWFLISIECFCQIRVWRRCAYEPLKCCGMVRPVENHHRSVFRPPRPRRPFYSFCPCTPTCSLSPVFLHIRPPAQHSGLCLAESVLGAAPSQVISECSRQ